ncbi:PREDICTED: uncharacterized protein LOC102030606 [Chinchilla lanigera]|uniref:uncharacterized protein LOC102030606 n=1 Tax=Chinchilla lanigera TaxID=34839 RepID=UPI0006976479|nr:PREDICTED: uncharacterized protein LOC102030606 [Chinchilla lanigera]
MCPLEQGVRPWRGHPQSCSFHPWHPRAADVATASEVSPPSTTPSYISSICVLVTQPTPDLQGRSQQAQSLNFQEEMLNVMNSVYISGLQFLLPFT